MERKAVLGIIGCGLIAQGVHIPNAFKNPRIRVKWCCDIMQQNLDIVKSQYSPEYTTTNHMDVINDPEVDGVMLLTTHDVRFSLVEQAAKAGKDIYVEKPMSTTVRESYDIMRVIRKYGVRLVVGFNRRCAPIIKDAVNILNDQKQNPKDAPWRYKRYPDMPAFKEGENTMVLMRINDDYLSFKGYSMDPFIGQGAIIGELCHFVDLACKVIGCEPVRVYVAGTERINQSLTLEFEDQSICTIFDAAIGSFDHPKEYMEIFHGGISMQLDHFLQLRVGGRTDVTKINYDFWSDPYPEVTEGEGANLYINKMQARNKAITSESDTKFPEVNKGHYNMLDAFVDCMLYDAPSPCNELDGARATLIVLKAVESSRLGLPVKINIAEYDFVMKEQYN